MTRSLTKLAEATAVPFPDSGVTQASTSPVPSLSVGNKPAPGLKGPKGLSPRTNYSRVNTGAMPTFDAGASSQKSTAPDAQSFLPPKIASEDSMGTNPSLTPRMTLQDMIKAAQAGAVSQVAISLEAARQLAQPEPAPSVKTASAIPGGPESVPSSYIDKLASAVEFIVKEATIGEGPNTLDVLEATSENNEVEAGQMGKAVEQNVPPMDPPLGKRDGVSGDPGNALQDNSDASHPAQPVDPMGNDRSIKAAAKKAPLPPPPAKGKAKKASSRLTEILAGIKKQAEDAINPAQISAGTIDPEKPPEGARESGQSGPSEPSDVSSQKRLISSNDAAINFTKREAKADPKSDASRVLVNPALSAAHDNTLGKAFDNTEKAGVKISHSVKAAAVRALLEKMAEEADKADKKDDKKKESMGAGGTFTAPPVGGAASAV